MLDIRKGICPLCDHDRIIEAWPADHTGGSGTVNLSVTETMSWKGPQLYGSLMTYICQGCGYTQWFTNNVQDIPIDAEHRTSIITGKR